MTVLADSAGVDIEPGHIHLFRRPDRLESRPAAKIGRPTACGQDGLAE